MLEKIKKILTNTKAGFLLNDLFCAIELKIMGIYHERETIDMLKEFIAEDKPFLLKPSELLTVYSFAKNQVDMEGDYAEVGVFKGTTAKAICSAKGNKNLHLFDTFDGLPSVGKTDSEFKVKMYKSDYERVCEKLSDYPNVRIYKGLFPDTAESLKDTVFSFAHIDVDTYQSTKDCLEFFFPRTSRAGIIISHDYHMEGVKKAFEEFFTGKVEKPLQLSLSQCVIIKR